MSKKERAEAQKKADLCAVLACTSRVLILGIIMRHKQISVQDIADALDMSHSAVSHQLGVLVTADMLAYTRVGRTAYYRMGTSHAARMARRILAK